MRRATAKSSARRSPTTEPGFQCRLGLPSAWSQPETRRTTLVRSHSHTSATSPIPLLSRVLPLPLAYLSVGLSRSRQPHSSVLSRLSAVRASLREIFLVPCDRQMRARALCRPNEQVVGNFEIQFAIFSSPLRSARFIFWRLVSK